MLAALTAMGLASIDDDDVAETARLLREGVIEYGPGSGEDANRARMLARGLHGRQTVVYGAGLTTPVARRWKGQINENAKAPAFWGELPEIDHNELMGWTSLPAISASTVGVFLDGDADPRLVRRVALTAEELRSRGLAVETVGARGQSRLARLFSLVQLGDYVSFYLALLYGVDPTPVGAIQALKSRLAAAGSD